MVTNSTVTDQVSAMCQQLSQGLSLLTNNDDLLGSKNNQVRFNFFQFAAGLMNSYPDNECLFLNDNCEKNRWFFFYTRMSRSSVYSFRRLLFCFSSSIRCSLYRLKICLLKRYPTSHRSWSSCSRLPRSWIPPTPSTNRFRVSASNPHPWNVLYLHRVNRWRQIQTEISQEFAG